MRSVSAHRERRPANLGWAADATRGGCEEQAGEPAKVVIGGQADSCLGAELGRREGIRAASIDGWRRVSLGAVDAIGTAGGDYFVTTNRPLPTMRPYFCCANEPNPGHTNRR